MNSFEVFIDLVELKCDMLNGLVLFNYFSWLKDDEFETKNIIVM